MTITDLPDHTWLDLTWLLTSDFLLYFWLDLTFDFWLLTFNFWLDLTWLDFWLDLTFDLPWLLTYLTFDLTYILAWFDFWLQFWLDLASFFTWMDFWLDFNLIHFLKIVDHCWPLLTLVTLRTVSQYFYKSINFHLSVFGLLTLS